MIAPAFVCAGRPAPISHMSPSEPFLSVLIPAYNEEALIARVIEAVRLSFAAAGRSDYEIVVCDNNSTDATAQIAESLGARVVFERHNQIARARNTAARASRGQWLIFVDGDTFLSPALLRATLEAVRSGKVCGGGAVLRFDAAKVGLLSLGVARLWNLVSGTFKLAAGSFLFCDRQAWADTGGFDEEFYAGEEIVFSNDVKEWGRARGLQFRIIESAPIVTSGRKMEWYGQWQLVFRVLRMTRPGAMKSREACGLWYTRPNP